MVGQVLGILQYPGQTNRVVGRNGHSPAGRRGWVGVLAGDGMEGGMADGMVDGAEGGRWAGKDGAGLVERGM